MYKKSFSRKRTGFILSLDAIVAVMILLTLSFFMLSLTFIFPSAELRYHRFYYVGKDMLNVVEQMKMSSVENFTIVQDYRNRGILIEEDMNKTFLDIVGSFWSHPNSSYDIYAQNLTGEILNSLFPQKISYQVLLGNDVIYEQNVTDKNYVARLSTIVSGYAHGKPASGYMARVYITKLNKLSSEFAYFGGYIGEGNITRIATLPDFDDVEEVYMELNVGSNFTLHMNGNDCGDYARTITGTDNMTVDRWIVCNDSYNPSRCSNLVEGNNVLTLNFTEPENSYIGGGYIKIKYDSSELVSIDEESLGQNASQRYYFPGIDGIINLYSSFYVPGSLQSMDVYLDYTSNYTVFLTVGNATVFESSDPSHRHVNITDQAIENNLSLWGLDYSALSNKTVPIRFGLRNITYLLYGRIGADTFSVTDVSGSMGWDSGVHNDSIKMCSYKCCNDWGCWSGRECIFTDSCVDAECGDCPSWRPNEEQHKVYYEDRNYTKLEIAQEANKAFVNRILNMSNTRIGLVSYATSIENVHDLSDNITSIKKEINRYEASGWTCICCGLVEASEKMVIQSNTSRFRAIVVMSDGEANVECTPYHVCYNDPACITRAKQDAIDAACEAWQDYNITVYAVGFGSDVDEITLQAIADCGNGEYYFSNTSELTAIYEDIAEEILNASYYAQTVRVYGNATTLNTTLYSNSYIQFNYTSIAEEFGYGEIDLTFESKTLRESTGEDLITDNVTGTKQGWYFVPNSTEVVDAKVTSYSSRFWTDRLFVKNEDMSDWARVHWLDDYNLDYKELGDPFILQIPVNYVKAAQNNTLKIGTGVSAANYTGGSPDNRVIYTVKIEVDREGYSDVFPKAKGSTYTLWYDTDQDNVADGSSNVQVGSTPSDIFDPLNDSIDDAFMRLLDKINFIEDTGDDDGSETNPIDLEITSDISFDSFYVSGVPSLWGPTKFEIRVWA